MMSPPASIQLLNVCSQWVARVRVSHLRLEVSLADGARHLVRYPEQFAVRPDTGRVLLYPVTGAAALQVEPGDVVALRAVPVDTPPWRLCPGFPRRIE